MHSYSCLSTAEFKAAGGIISVQPSGDHYLVAGLLPEGITTALIADAPVSIGNGFLMTTAATNPGTLVRVYGPGADQVVTGLMPALRSTFDPQSAYGPGYSVLTTPTPEITTGTP